ncbi:S9 family peptidase [Rhodanobacter sp. B05]|uniref:alpha/beta hydrolase family protein n=1 Tax=Rhodanobacter sp. B05 TaxID=1945859 RepID=UPI000985D96E|nr:prolyl oligopeptidase family serine peptidase [Rhodanobacter sp. B05]OOG52884.1 S9 family peptidase [Rhodanobacter sp. B05]
MLRALRHLLTIALLCTPLAALTAPAALLPVGDFARHPQLSNPSLSPDGQMLAVSVRNTDKDGSDSYQLAVLHLPDLKVLSRLDMARRNVPGQVVWVSNTRLVVALAYQSAWLDIPQMTGEIVALDYDGSHKATLYSLRARGSSIHSQDMPIGYATIADVPEPRNNHLYVDLHPASTGNYTLFSSDSSMIYDVDTSSGAATLIGKINKGSMHFVMHDGIARFAVGSPDAGATINTYTRDNKDQPWRLMPASVTGKLLTPERISADGSRMWSMYSANGGPEQLVSSKLDGSDREVLASDSFASVGDVLWAPHHGAPYAASLAVGRPHFVALDDNPLAQVLQALSEKFPDEAIDIAGHSDDGMVLLIHAYSDRDPGTYALFDRNSMNLRPLFQSEPWIKSAQMAVRKPIRFKAGDGMELDGYVTVPLDGARSHPMVLVPHGGPIGIADGWAYDADAQFLATRGYTVLQVNYRGSSGRGMNFQHAGYKQFGDRIQHDLIDGVHWAIDQGYTDNKHICVYGGSFGGYSSLMQPILAPGLYQCAIDYAGVADWAIGMEYSDTSHFTIGKTYFANAIGDVAAARAISPLYQLDKFNVPVLIAHGKADPRVPFRNATALRSALDKAGKPYVWLVKPKEGHGFYSEADRTDLLQHMQDFLAKYLGG